MEIPTKSKENDHEAAWTWCIAGAANGKRRRVDWRGGANSDQSLRATSAATDQTYKYELIFSLVLQFSSLCTEDANCDAGETSATFYNGKRTDVLPDKY